MYSNIPSITLHWHLNQNSQLVVSEDLKYTPRSSQKLSCVSCFFILSLERYIHYTITPATSHYFTDIIYKETILFPVHKNLLHIHLTSWGLPFLFPQEKQSFPGSLPPLTHLTSWLKVNHTVLILLQQLFMNITYKLQTFQVTEWCNFCCAGHPKEPVKAWSFV